MFDIGFMELLLIFVVALLVLGPDKLPGAIRTGALWFGRAKRSFNKVKSEIEQQINTDEIRRQLHNESILGDIDEARKNANKLIKDTQSEIKSTEDSVKRSIGSAGKSGATTKMTSSADEGVPTPPPENYKTGDGTRTAPAPAEPKVTTPEVTDTDAIDDNSAATDKASPKATSQPEQTPTDPAPDTKKTMQDTPPSQDIYSTPPAGIVSMQNGKFSAVNDKPKASDSSSGKK